MGIFGNAFNGWHLLIILAIVLLLFGAPKLPALARSIGQSMKIFRKEMRPEQADAAATGTAESAAAPAPAPEPSSAPTTTAS